MATGWHEKPHVRTSSSGKIYRAGQGKKSLMNTLGTDVDYVRHFVRKEIGAKKFAAPKKPKPITTVPRKRKGF